MCTTKRTTKQATIERTITLGWNPWDEVAIAVVTEVLKQKTGDRVSTDSYTLSRFATDFGIGVHIA